MLASLLLLAACKRDCPDGYTNGGGSLCIEATPSPADVEAEWSLTTEGLTAALPACEPVSTDGRLDPWNGCADDVCVGDDLSAAEAAWGAGDCDDAGCEWQNGVSIDLEDDVVTEVVVEEPWDGGSTDGLGLGASFACFLDAFGNPSAVLLLGDGDDLEVWSVSFSDPDVNTFDDDALGGDGDGTVNSIYMEGPGD